MLSQGILRGTQVEVSDYQFERSDLRIGERRPGISAFMRIRDGADFLEATIRSHIDEFDEIVAVYNQCSDQTPEILSRLQREFGSQRLRVIHYLDRVYPQGTLGHASTAPDSVHSVVNYSNFALAATRHQYVTKLDDDHIAIAETTKRITQQIRAGDVDDGALHCFSGLNLICRPDGTLGVLAHDPISGSGDIGFFRITEKTFFVHDRRFERFCRGALKRRFIGFLYWHCKFLKSSMGFGNYELKENPESRFEKKRSRLQDSPIDIWDLQQLAKAKRSNAVLRLLGRLSAKHELLRQRDDSIATQFPVASVSQAFRDTLSPSLLSDSSIAKLLDANDAESNSSRSRPHIHRPSAA